MVWLWFGYVIGYLQEAPFIGEKGLLGINCYLLVNL